MSESNKRFTVKDRRHFTPEGDVRETPKTPAESESSDGAEAPSAPPESPAPSTSGAEPEETGEAPPPGEGARSPRTGGEAREAGPADFGQFLLSLGAQAGMLLSGQGMPEGADAGEALAGARSIISILEMLKEKTEGRRTSQEDEILEGLLFELRMAYVEKSRTGGS
jgi:hypothetical protein